MSNVQIITDSTADLSLELAKEKNIAVIPLYVVLEMKLIKMVLKYLLLSCMRKLNKKENFLKLQHQHQLIFIIPSKHILIKVKIFFT